MTNVAISGFLLPLYQNVKFQISKCKIKKRVNIIRLLKGIDKSNFAGSRFKICRLVFFLNIEKNCFHFFL